VPRHKNKTSFIKGDPRITGKQQSKEHIEKRALPLRNKIKVKCDYCNKKIEIVPSVQKNLKHHFCNRNCYIDWFRKTGWKERSYNLTKEGRAIILKVVGNNGKKIWRNKTQQEKQEWIEKMRQCQRIRPTKPEKKMMEIIKEYNLPYKYVGDGSFWIGKNPSVNPDFINVNGAKKVIEVFGDYWHRNDNGRREKQLKNYGYKCIVIWESEFKKFSKKEIIKRIIGG